MSERKSLRILDPRIARESQVVDLISEGPSSVTYQRITTPDGASKSPSFVIQAPTPLTGVNRTMRLRVKGNIVLTGTNLETLTTAQSRVALRQNALQAIMQSLNVQINDFTTQVGNISLIIGGLAQLANTSESMAGTGSTYASTPDLFTDYNMDVGRAGGLFDIAGAGPYGDSLVCGRTAQIVYPGVVASTAPATTLTVYFDISEDLIVSPFNYADREQKYIFGVGNMTITCSYANYHRLLSYAPTSTSTVTGCALNLTDQFLECTFVTPDDTSLIQRPFKHVYDWSQVQSWTTSGPASVAAPNPSGTNIGYTTFNITSNSIELPVVPSKLIVYATYSNTDVQDVTKSLPDVCFAMADCTIQFGTRAGLLSGASQVNLWEVSRRGGSHAKYPVWAGKQALTSVPQAQIPIYAGSPLIIDVAADLSLPHGAQPVTPGMSTRIQFSISANFVNQTAATITYPKLVVIAITPGYIAAKDGASLGQLGGVTLEAARSAPIAPILQADSLTALGKSEGLSGGGRMTGGGFFDDLGDALSHAVTGTISAAPMLALHAFGAGSPVGGASIGGSPVGGAMIGGSDTARRLLGGRLMGARQMGRA